MTTDMSIFEDTRGSQEQAEIEFQELIRRALEAPDIDYAAESNLEVLSRKASRIAAEKKEFLKADAERVAKEIQENPYDHSRGKSDAGIKSSDSVVWIQGNSDSAKNSYMIEFTPRSDYFAGELLRIIKPYLGNKEVTFDRSSRTTYHLKFVSQQEFEKALKDIEGRYSHLGYEVGRKGREQETVKGFDNETGNSFAAHVYRNFEIPPSYYSKET